MIFRLAPRAVAAAVVASLLVTVPGVPAWAQTAAMVRPGSVGATLTGAAGTSGVSQGNGGPTAMSLTLPAASLSGMTTLSPAILPTQAGALVAPSALVSAMPAASKPAPIAETGAVAVPTAKPVALAVAVKPAVSVAQDVRDAAAVSASKSVASASALASGADVAAAKGEGVMGAVNAFFDGLKARKPIQDAVDAGEGKDAPNASQLRKPQHELQPVLVTLQDPGSPELLAEFIRNITSELGFEHDASYAPTSAPGLVAIRGAIPASRLIALRETPGVLDVSNAVSADFAARYSKDAKAAVAAPARESALRGGLRSIVMKRPMLAVLVTLPLTMGLFAAFFGPVTAGFMLSGAAAVLKPWLLGTIAGMASLSYLAPLLGWIPFKLRATAAFAAAGGVSVLAFGLMPAVPAFWLAANLSVGFLAALRGSVMSLRGVNPLERAIRVAEANAFTNLLGYSVIVPVLLLGGMAPLATGILATGTLLALALFFRSGPRKLALQDPGPAASTPDPQKPGDVKKPVADAGYKPFVPATVVIAALEKLLKTDPDAAFKSASESVLDSNERRSEIKIYAMRVIDGFPIAKSAPVYAQLLEKTAANGIQLSKQANVDPWWYLQREALRSLTRAIEGGWKDEAVYRTVVASYKDRNSSVRLAAAAAIRAWGDDPGPEPHDSLKDSAPTSAPQFRPANSFTPDDGPSAPKKKGNGGKWFIGIVLAIVVAWMSWATLNPTPKSAPVERPAVTQVAPAQKAPQTITSEDGTTYVVPQIAPVEKKDAVKAPAQSQEESLEQIAKNTDRTAKAMEDLTKPRASSGGSIFGGLVGQILMMVLGAFIFLWVMRRFGGGGMGGGGSAGGIKTSPNMDLEKPKTKFDDVAGIDESLIELQELIDFMRNPGRYKRLGARIPKGILMEGPPGTGKTLLARALAGETNATFISISGSDFVELYVGMGARRVRELFETARKNGPAIIFIDEIDAVGKRRGDGGPGSGSNDEREQTINQILAEMDGFDNSSGVIVIAATNRADTLDPALTRPGRFDRKIHVGLPEALGREAILALHAKKARLGPDVDLRLIARRTAGLSGAFLENVINEAALLAARRGGDSVSAADIDEAVDRATIGGKRNLRLSDKLKFRIAAHEAGHVLANLLNEDPELRSPVNKVTIIPHGSGALGFAESGSEEGDKYLYTREELEARIDTALGGLVAEKLFFGTWSTGPGSDLESATRVARAMVQQLAMVPGFLAQSSPNQYGQSPFGSEVDAKAFAEINKILSDRMAIVEARLKKGEAKHKLMIERLMEKETLGADEIAEIAWPKDEKKP